ncbi:unnamed protein product, partial [Rotaria magnacalcarata]
MSQYDPCSSHAACSCFHMADDHESGICSDEFLNSCSELVPCNEQTNLCNEFDHKCLHHPRCYNHPVCYPVPSFNQQYCPSLT